MSGFDNSLKFKLDIPSQNPVEQVPAAGEAEFLKSLKERKAVKPWDYLPRFAAKETCLPLAL